MFLDDELNNTQNEDLNNQTEPTNEQKNEQNIEVVLNEQNTNTNPEHQELEVVLGDDSNLEISIVGDLENDLKPRVQKRQNIVIPIPTKIANKETTIINESENSQSNQENSSESSNNIENSNNTEETNENN